MTSGIDTVFYGEFEYNSGFWLNPVKKILMKDFAGKFRALFFIWFGYKIDAPIFPQTGLSCRGPGGELRAGRT